MWFKGSHIRSGFGCVEMRVEQCKDIIYFIWVKGDGSWWTLNCTSGRKCTFTSGRFCWWWWWPVHQEQFGVQYLTQGHFEMQTRAIELIDNQFWIQNRFESKIDSGSNQRPKNQIWIGSWYFQRFTHILDWSVHASLYWRKLCVQLDRWFMHACKLHY